MPYRPSCSRKSTKRRKDLRLGRRPPRLLLPAMCPPRSSNPEHPLCPASRRLLLLSAGKGSSRERGPLTRLPALRLAYHSRIAITSTGRSVIKGRPTSSRETGHTALGSSRSFQL